MQPVHTSRMPLRERVATASQRQYIAKVAILYDGKPLRYFSTTVKAHSRPHAATKINDGLSLKLLSVVREKKKTDEKR